MDSIIQSILNGTYSATQILGPAVVGLLTVPVFDQAKKLGWIGKLPPTGKQVLVLVLALILTRIGAGIESLLPIGIFADPEVSALLSASIAYAIHAGRKASEAAKPLNAGD